MELELKDYLKMVRKRLWMLLAIVVASCLATGVVSYWFLKPVCQASTKLIVNKPNERVGVEQLTINDVNLNIRIIDTYKEIIKTPYIMDLVAREYPEFNLTSEQLIQKVKVSSVNNTQVMTLVVEDYSHEKAVNIVNAVSKVFQREIPKVMKVDNVSLLSEAKIVEQPKPVKPNHKLNIAISFVVSLMIGVGLIFVLEYLDDTLKTESDIEKYLGLPTLSIVTKIKPEDIEGALEKAQTTQVGEGKYVNTPLQQ